MKKRYLSLVIVAGAALFISSCSRASAVTTTEEPPLTKIVEMARSTNNSGTTSSEFALQSVPGNDNTDIVSTHDGDGNLVETRTFRTDRFIRAIVVRTLADGTKEAVVHLRSGDKQRLNTSRSASALTLSGSQINNWLPRDMVVQSQKGQDQSVTSFEGTAAPLYAQDRPVTQEQAQKPEQPAPADRKAEEAKVKAEQKDLGTWLPPRSRPQN